MPIMTTVLAAFTRTSNSLKALLQFCIKAGHFINKKLLLGQADFVNVPQGSQGRVLYILDFVANSGHGVLIDLVDKRQLLLDNALGFVIDFAAFSFI